MAKILPYPFYDLCLKGVYFTLIKNCSDNLPKNFESLDFLKNCLVEIYGIEFVQSYQHAFIYIRQLAVTLRRGLESEKDVNKKIK
jgi:nucleolar complex protein 2